MRPNVTTAIERVSSALNSGRRILRNSELVAVEVVRDAAERGARAERAVHGVTWLYLHGASVVLERCPKKARVLGVGEWFVPGGKIEPGETEEVALAREIAEEWPTVELNSLVALPLVEGSPVNASHSGVFLMRPFVVTVRGILPKESGDGVPLRWVSVREALQSPVPQVRMMVAAAYEKAGRHVSANGRDTPFNRAHDSEAR